VGRGGLACQAAGFHQLGQRLSMVIMPSARPMASWERNWWSSPLRMRLRTASVAKRISSRKSVDRQVDRWSNEFVVSLRTGGTNDEDLHARAPPGRAGGIWPAGPAGEGSWVKEARALARPAGRPNTRSQLEVFGGSYCY